MVRHFIFSQDEILDASKEDLFKKVAEVLNEEADRSNVFDPLAESNIPRYDLTGEGESNSQISAHFEFELFIHFSTLFLMDRRAIYWPCTRSRGIWSC